MLQARIGQWVAFLREDWAPVNVGGLLANIFLSMIVFPALYVWFAGLNDTLPAVEGRVC